MSDDWFAFASAVFMFCGLCGFIYGAMLMPSAGNNTCCLGTAWASVVLGVLLAGAGFMLVAKK